MSLAQAQEQAARFLIAEAVASVPRGSGFFQAQVVAVSAAGTPTLSWQGGRPFPATCSALYTPVVGDLVLVAQAGLDPVVMFPLRPIS